MAESPRVLSIQSHVVFGYVGNKSATLPLQLLGFEVDAINSVQFSNHTGYGKFKGQVLSDTDLDDLVKGLSMNDLDHYTHLLTGYIGSASFLNRIASLVKHLKEINPNLIYVCDPVMGDNGKMYVPEELLPIYKESIVPLADIITPNQFEAELLTGQKITCVDDAWKAIKILQEKGCKTVVLSSTELGDQKHLLAIASSKAGNQSSAATINIPKLPACFTGTGDLFASLFLAWIYKTDNCLKEALERTIGTLQAVLKRTLNYATVVGVSPKSLELKLIQSKADIENPEPTVTATIL
ncbi:hypothetical protein ILUMI_00452 [Ignelater luminosus]|uniref:Pyridoxal kinase n=1 Tax=Ignelater luminosus TaxID=2038154 RepID=A0A8K0DH81_IGNLU|nr:hypothetical protein ILUMI_00452 [Ignelater luminosus]